MEEKEICKAIQKASKYGYQLEICEGCLQIAGQSWYLCTSMREAPRKVLAIIVEHLGYLPSDICCRVTKSKEDYIVQDMIKSDFLADMNINHNEDNLIVVTNIGVTLWGMSLLYGENNNLYAASLQDLSLFGWPIKHLNLIKNNFLFSKDKETGAELLVKCINQPLREENLVIWNALKEIDWLHKYVERDEMNEEE